MSGRGTYVVTFPVVDPDRPQGELKAEARSLVAMAAKALGLNRLGPVDARVVHAAEPTVVAEVPVSWTGPAPDVASVTV